MKLRRILRDESKGLCHALEVRRVDGEGQEVPSNTVGVIDD